MKRKFPFLKDYLKKKEKTKVSCKNLDNNVTVETKKSIAIEINYNLKKYYLRSSNIIIVRN